MDVELNSDQPKVILQGQPLINAKLRFEKKPQQLLLNNEKVKVDYSSEKLVNLQVNQTEQK
jgi:hypothetical protein